MSPLDGKWTVSEYMDDGRIGIITDDNVIVFGVSVGLSRDIADRITAYHNKQVERATEAMRP